MKFFFVGLLSSLVSIVSYGQNASNVEPDSVLAVFTDQFENGFKNKGWGGVFEITSDKKRVGKQSIKSAFSPEKEWGTMKLVTLAPVELKKYNFLSFWIKGADSAKKVTIFMNGGNEKNIDVPANDWTFFKLNLQEYFPEVAMLNSLSFQIMRSGKTLFFDEIIFSK